MRAGRSSWLCHGTMPPGAIVSLRKRSSRSFRGAGCFSRSIAPRVTSLTPTGLKSTLSRALACILSAGHSPAEAELVKVDPATAQANARPCQSAREVTDCLNILLSPLFCRRLNDLAGDGEKHDGDLVLKEMPVDFRLDSAALCGSFTACA